jgi:hypothetical protein
MFASADDAAVLEADDTQEHQIMIGVELKRFFDTKVVNDRLFNELALTT